MAQEVFMLENEDGSRFSLEKPGLYTVGAPDSTVPIVGDDLVVPEHFSLITAGARVMLRPQAGEVYINGQQVTQMVTVQVGDQIAFGNTVLWLVSMEKSIAMENNLLSTDAFRPLSEVHDSGVGPPPPTPSPPPPQPTTQAPSLVMPQQQPPPQQPPPQSAPSSNPPSEVTQPPPQYAPPHDPGPQQATEYEVTQPVQFHQKPDETQLEEYYIEDGPTTPDGVVFTSYFPSQAVAELRYSLLVYAHLDGLQNEVLGDVRKFIEEYSGEYPNPRTSKDGARVRPGAPITVRLESEDLDIAPPVITKNWDDEWVRFIFDFKAPQGLEGRVVNVNVSIQVTGIEIARIHDCEIEITAQPPAMGDTQMHHKSGYLFHRIFMCYTQSDRAVVDAYRAAQLAASSDIFIDVDRLIQAPNWRQLMMTAINKADSFQLFWSAQSAQSEAVEMQWSYALQTVTPEQMLAGFVRAVYWDEPLTPPPPELGHLQFRHINLTMVSD